MAKSNNPAKGATSSSAPKRIHQQLKTSVSKELFYDPNAKGYFSEQKGKSGNVYSVDRYYDPNEKKDKSVSSVSKSKGAKKK